MQKVTNHAHCETYFDIDGRSACRWRTGRGRGSRRIGRTHRPHPHRLTRGRLPDASNRFAGQRIGGSRPLFVSVDASSPKPGQTTFTAPGSDSTCSTNAAGSLIRVTYRNLGTGAAGSTTVKLCPYFLDPTPVESTVNTGSGAVVISVAITGSWAYPNAGQPSLPGVGGFIAP